MALRGEFQVVVVVVVMVAKVAVFEVVVVVAVEEVEVGKLLRYLVRRSLVKNTLPKWRVNRTLSLTPLTLLHLVVAPGTLILTPLTLNTDPVFRGYRPAPSRQGLSLRCPTPRVST